MKEKLEAEADLGARVVSVGVSVSWATSVAIEQGRGEVSNAVIASFYSSASSAPTILLACAKYLSQLTQESDRSLRRTLPSFLS